MKTPIKSLLFCLLSILSVSIYAANNNSGNNSGNNNQSNSSTTTTKPAYVDPVNSYMTLYDTNHDGKLEVNELKRMAILDPAAYQIAQAFVNSRGELGIDEIAAWRIFLKSKATSTQSKISGS